MKDKVEKIIKNFTWVDWLLISLLCSGLIYLLLFSLSLWQRPDRTVEYLAIGEKVDRQIALAEIWLDVSGAVVSPGVYQLTNNARVKDALVAAGGLTDKADRDFVSTTINLAAKVKDGDKIYIPFEGEDGSGQRQQVLGTTNQGKVNLNKATAAELESLTGIGAVRAGMIIDNRPYASVDDLVTKKVLSQSIFDKIRDRVAVY